MRSYNRYIIMLYIYWHSPLLHLFGWMLFIITHSTALRVVMFWACQEYTIQLWCECSVKTELAFRIKIWIFWSRCDDFCLKFASALERGNAYDRKLTKINNSHRDKHQNIKYHYRILLYCVWAKYQTNLHKSSALRNRESKQTKSENNGWRKWCQQ